MSLVAEQSRGILEHCTIIGNERVGIDIRQESNPYIRYCTIQQHGIVGIWVHDNSGGRVEYCDVTMNTRGAWHIEEGSQLSRTGNKE
ncbi:MAG: right-handed parallel beta-helix repeat-containing protein [Chloroflexaceae bacterium]|nr:right-handed parallel beta-helix repeat-containing protein [Chloroflexaceae bacterium]